MSDALSGLGQGAMNYFSKAQSNKNARAQNATNDKWGPLLALNKSKGAANIDVPKASFAEIMGPAIQNAMNQSGSGGGGGGGGGMNPMMMAGDQGEGGGGGGGMMDMLGGGSGGMMMAAGGGMVPRGYAGGGQQGGGMGDMMGSVMKMLPMIAMMLSTGGKIPGKSNVPGDSPMNDTQLTATSPGEVVLPKTVAQEGMKGNKWKVAAYLNEVKKHGPGPMPIKAQKSGAGMGMGPQSGKPKSSSMSPWEAMACGGMTR